MVRLRWDGRGCARFIHPFPFKQDTGAGEFLFCGLHANGYCKYKERDGDMIQVSRW